jgi:hypothetical protein
MKEVDVRGAYVVLSENGLLPKSGTKKRAS